MSCEAKVSGAYKNIETNNIEIKNNLNKVKNENDLVDIDDVSVEKVKKELMKFNKVI